MDAIPAAGDRPPMPRRSVLFLPADALPPGLTRSWWLAYALSRHFDVHYLRWEDARTARLRGKAGPLASPRALALSLLGRTALPSTTLPPGRRLHLLRAPVAINATVARLVGDLAARRAVRWFNGHTLDRLVRRLRPDAIFHGDGFYYFPGARDASIPDFSDIQDDFDAPDSPVQRYEAVYGRPLFGRCRGNFAIDAAAARRFAGMMGADFRLVPNGVELAPFRRTPAAEIEALRARLGLSGRWVLSYIGTRSHLDEPLLLAIADALAVRMPDARLLVVGPAVQRRPNIVAAGFVEPSEVHRYFLASDLGLAPAPNPASNFIFHSVPLKIVQYGAARRFVVSVPNRWIQERAFPNVTVLAPDVDAWVAAIERLRGAAWDPAWDAVWEAFDWDVVAAPVVRAVREALG